MKRDNLIWGLVLIALGGTFLIDQLFPGLLFNGDSWPWIMLIIGGIFVIGSLIGRKGGMMIPGLVLLTLGGIFTYQVRTGNWESWAYVWGLLPAAAGLGMFIGSLYDIELRHQRRIGVMMVLGGLLAFAIFAGAFGFLGVSVLRFWPVLLILLGVFVLLKALRGQREL